MMDDGAFAEVRPDWTPQRSEEVLRRVHARLRRRHRSRRMTLAATALAIVIAAGAIGWRRWQPPAAEATLRLDDGSTIEPIGAHSEVAIAELAVDRRVVLLSRGGARIDARENATRPLRIVAGQVSFEVLGTAFRVERVGDGAHVRVERGRLRVTWSSGQSLLNEGEGGTFPPLPARPSTEPQVEEVPPVETRAAPARPIAWRALAQKGRYDDAWRAMTEERRRAPDVVPDEPATLLLAADVARLSRHPIEAVAPLRRLVDRHPRDPRAGLASFTLGLVLLQELGRPREAAAAFARSLALEPGGDLAEDALAREVEAHFRAGDLLRAEQRAQAYVQRHPHGRRIKAVRRFGGLE